MKLSERTLLTLKNFANINAGVVFRPGKTQKTWSFDKSILVETELDDDFPCLFGVYDLNQFLGNLTTLNSPELTFNEDHVILDDGMMKINYKSCDPELISSPPNKSLSIDDPSVKFVLTNVVFSKISKLAVMNRLQNISVVGQTGVLKIKAHDIKNDKSNEIITDIGDWTGEDFICTFHAENLKILPDDYTVSIKKNVFSEFRSTSRNLTYFITLLAV